MTIPKKRMQWPDSQPHHPLSQDLLALSTLTPPSPILSSTHLIATWSWSEIHVELDFDADAVIAERPLSTAHAGVDAAEIPPSSSVSTVSTVGTFGPIRRRDDTRDTDSWSPTSKHFEEPRIVSKLSANDVPNIFCSPSRAVQATSMPCNNDQERTAPPKLAASGSAFRFMSSAASAIRNETIQHSVVADHLTCSHLPLSLLSLHSPAEKEDIVSFQAPDRDYLPSPSLQPSESCPTAGMPNNQVKLTDKGNSADALTRQLAFAATLATLEAKCYSAPSSPQGPQAPPPSDDCNQRSKHDLPKSLTWLAETVVEVLIDQEGFRGVLARFKYTGYLGPGSAPDRHQYGTAQFRPINRQIFNFHYAPLEGLPVLRRITVNGEESRDYISRQASLGLKVNGVYFVRGNETLSFLVLHTPDEGTAAESSKLQWRFEYMVDDRRVAEASGKKIVDGEKVLTPLSFSCSPLLLHPLQGKRIRLLHVVKKSVITKLVAEKMEPPSLRSSIGSLAKTRTTKSQLPAPHRLVKSQAYAWSTHKRSATHCAPRDNENKTICEHGLPALQFDNTATQDMVSSQSPRSHRRRASSAGECNRPGNTIVSPYVHLSPQGNSPLCQNIVPPSRLAALLDTEESPKGTVCTIVRSFTSPVATPPPNYVEASSFYPLSPSPRHHSPPVRTS